MLHFDICAVIVLAILISAVSIRKLYVGKLNTVFFILLLITAVTAAADIVASLLDDYVADHYTAKSIAHTAYLFFHNLQPLVFQFFVIAFTDTWHTLRKHKTLLIVSLVPISIVAISLISNFFNSTMFYYDEAGVYQRGEFFYIFYVSAAIYLAIGLIYLLKYKVIFTPLRFSALFSMFPLLMVATVVQMIYPSLWIEMFASSISLLYINLIIIRAEEVIDSDTNLMSMTAYLDNMKSATITHKHCKVIMINITNFDIIRRMMGYQNSRKAQEMIANNILDLTKELYLDSELYYIGNGKFRIVVNHHGFANAVEAAERINAAMKKLISISDTAINLIACVCIVEYPEDIGDAESLIAFGNELNGKYYTGEVLYAKDIYQRSRYEVMRDIDGIIDHALANDEFEVYYQPIYSVKEKRFTTAEALCRLKTDDGHFISPDIFIKAAEESGAIHKIGSFVLNDVCSFIASDDYKSLGLDYIEVNLSVAQCMQESLAGDVLATLARHKVNSSQINLEITETAASYSQNTLMENLNTLSNSGIRFSLDDFGTGYSNMMRIASLPLHIVKLDKTFSDYAKNSNTNIVLSNTIRMIKELKMQIVVEGVETADMAKKYSELNCEYIQGYYYSKPMPKAEFVKFIKSNVA